MKARELIKLLEQFDPQAEVKFLCQDGSIDTIDSICEADCDKNHILLSGIIIGGSNTHE